MRRPLGVIVLALLAVGSVARAEIVPPRPGVEIPQAYLEMLAQDRNAFRFERAWIGKAERARAAREQYIAERGFFNRDLMAAQSRASYTVSGTIEVPVFCVKYSNTGADPYPTATLQTKLFDGPYTPRTLTQYYSEISYGDLTMTGTIYGWTQLPNVDTYYEAGCNGIFCGTGLTRLGQLMTTTLSANDASIDFGDYDNDGPDGIPNSGDDDGYVDFVAFVQPEAGGECGGTNIWSHRWVLTALTGSPYTTNDARNGGGSILIDDYVIQPAYNCGGATVIDIGVFCHEFGHAVGLPDLYDTNGGSEGIGHWGLMGAGNWNTTLSPAHMSAWSKAELGWVNVVEVDGIDTDYTLTNVEFNRPVWRLGVMDERWRRSTDCVITGSYSMHCALNSTEAAAQNWIGGSGYGNGWREKIAHDFTWDGTTPVNLQYSYSHETEVGWDFAYVRVEVNGNVTTLATYNGTGSGTGNHDLTAALSGSGASGYTVTFEFESDGSYSDRDGLDPTTCGAFTVDNVSVNGGGVSYSTDFEAREDGWYVPEYNEYFLVENRQPVGSDGPLAGAGGIVIWHVDQNQTRAANSVNTGGSAGNQPFGVAMVQADGLNHLGTGVNRGDSGDPYPGSTNNLSLTNGSSPSSLGFSATTNNVAVQVTSSNPANGGSMTATMRGGWSAPTYTSNNPTSGDNNGVAVVVVTGGNIAHGADVALDDGVTLVPAASVEWVGKDYVIASIDLNGVPAATYDVVVTNPGGASVTAASAFTVNDANPTALRSIVAHNVDGVVELVWETVDDLGISGWYVYRSTFGETGYIRMTEFPLDAGVRSWIDENPEPGVLHNYRLTWITSEGEEIAGQAGVRTGALQYALHQNYPNPFNPTTVIPFELKERVQTSLRIYNLRGQLVRTLVDETLDARTHEVTWDGRNNEGMLVSSGVYFYRIVAGSFQDVRKLILVK